MGVVEALHQGGDILIGAEFRARQRHFDLPHLFLVTRLHGETGFGTNRTGARSVAELPALSVQAVQHGIGPFTVEHPGGHEFGRGVGGAQVRQHCAGGAQRRGSAGDQHRPTAEPVRDAGTVKTPAPAPADQQSLARVDALVEGDFLDGGDHAFRRQGQDRGSCLVQVQPQRFCNVAGDNIGGRFDCHFNFTAQEVIRVQVPQHETGVGHRRPVAAALITGRAGIGPRADGPDVQHAARVHPGDAAAAGADATHVHGRKTGDVAGLLVADHGLACRRDLAAAQHADVESGAAGVGDDGRGHAAAVQRGKVPACDRGAGRT